MRTPPTGTGGLRRSNEPYYVLQLSWDDADTDHTYLTSNPNAQVPIESPAVDTIHSVITDIGGQTQKINPDIATSTIGNVTVKAVDRTDTSSPPVTLLTDKINTKLAGGDSLRGKLARVYVGYEGLPFTSYDLRLTYIVDSMTYRDGLYTFKLSDIQRQERKRIFTPDETQLQSRISATDLIIPVATSDTSKFQLIERGAEVANFPTQTISYIKIDDEVIAINTQPQFDTTNGWHVVAVQRGALATRPVEHSVDDGIADNRKPVITEHIFLEGAVPKIIYALLTGVLLNGSSPEATLPDHWHLGIDTDFVRLADFQGLGDDFWNTTTNAGRFVRIENPDTQDGKKFIETEMLVWLGAFMPIYSDGQLGIKRLAPVLSDSGYVAQLDAGNIVTYSNMDHDFRSVINQVRVYWNHVDARSDFTKDNLLIDAESIAIHGAADLKEYEFKTVHTGAHTDENILAYFDTLRDRYSGPPLEMTATVLPSMNLLEVGDTVRVTLDQIRDFNTGGTLDRTFEIQQVTTNWMTGDLKLTLFASSQAAGELDRTTISSVMADGYYISAGTSLDSSDSPAGPLTIVAGAVTANGTITGNADMSNSGAIYFYDGDLTINAGVTVTITDNVQLRIKGALTVNGKIDGAGQGPAGGAATTLLENAATNDTWAYGVGGILTNPLEAQDVDFGSDGYFGIVRSGAAFDLFTGPFNPQGQPPAYNEGTYIAPVMAPDGWQEGGATLDQRPTKGTVSALPWFDIANPNGWVLTGTPTDLRGHGGPGGLAMTTTESDLATATGSQYIRGNGGAGGDGGAGLMILCRGLSFGGSGEIDLSGGDAGNPTAYTIGGAKTFYGGHGAPGAPGGLLMLIDGNYTNPDIDNNTFTANMGDVGTAAGATDISQADYLASAVVPNTFATNVVYWPYASAVFNIGAFAANQDTDMSSSAHRLQYLPEAQQEEPFFGGPLTERGQFNDLLFNQRSTVVNGDGYGYQVTMTPDGSRFVATRVTNNSPTLNAFVVSRSVKNPQEEQLVNGPVAQVRFGYAVIIGDDGERIAVWDQTDITGASGAGSISIYSRSGFTWSLEQTIQSGDAGPTALGNFGGNMIWDKNAEHLLCVHNSSLGAVPAGKIIEYWSRSGTTWSYQETLPESVTAGTSYSGIGAYANGLFMSSDGLWAVASCGTDDNGGTLYLFQRTTNSPMWELVDTLNVPGYNDDPSNLMNWNFGGTRHVIRNVLCNYDCTAIAVYGERDAADGGGQWLHAIERQGNTLVYIGRTQLDNNPPDNPMVDIRLNSISDNGLLVLTHDTAGSASSPVGTGAAALYRRNNISEPFKFNHSFDSNQVTDYGNSESVFMSKTGQFVIIGDFASDFGQPNSGHVEIWEYYPEAD